MVTQQVAINMTNEFLKGLKDIGINLKKAYLFGSYARNKQHEHSDIDVALIADEFVGVGPVDIKTFLKILRNYILIHPKTYSTAEFEDGNPFLEEIKKTGIEISINPDFQ